MTRVEKDVIRKTDAEAIQLARRLVRTARSGSLAVIDPDAGYPLASRVGVATDADGAPLVLVSQLSAHTPAMLADPRCSLLLGETGKGDPLAHPRITLVCLAQRLAPSTPEDQRARRRYLNRNPKARLYIGLGDFSIFRLELQRASLNGGFGKAYVLDRNDLLLAGPMVEALANSEQAALEHMNADHLEAIAAIASHFTDTTAKNWTMTGVDLEGIDIAAGDIVERVLFPEILRDASDLRPALSDLTRKARGGQQSAPLPA